MNPICQTWTNIHNVCLFVDNEIVYCLVLKFHFILIFFFPPRTHCQSHDFLVIQLLALLVKDNVYWFFYCSIDAPCVYILVCVCVCVYVCYLKLINFKYIPLIVSHMKKRSSSSQATNWYGPTEPFHVLFFSWILNWWNSNMSPVRSLFSNQSLLIAIPASPQLFDLWMAHGKMGKFKHYTASVA
jgi:hypothetical protein